MQISNAFEMKVACFSEAILSLDVVGGYQMATAGTEKLSQRGKEPKTAVPRMST